MSGIYIPGLRLQDRRSHPAVIKERDGKMVIIVETSLSYNERTVDVFPLLPVPDHGRLIDADIVSDKLRKLMHPSDMANNQWFINTLREMPTIIPADKEETT